MLNIKKEDWARFGVIALIIIFAFSTVAVYLGIYSNSGSSQQLASNPKVYSGYASANATLTSYDPSLDVVGDTPELTSLLKTLKAQNIVVQDISTTDGRLVVLSDPASVFNVSKMIESIGLKAYADAVISTGPITVVDSTGAVHNANSSIIKQKMAPVFFPGDNFSITFNAQIADSNLYATSNINIVPGAQLNAEITPENVSIKSTSLAAIIPWDKRYLNYSAFNSSISDYAQINYSPRTFVAFAQQLPQATLQQISLSSPDYIVSVQPNLIAIRANFEDKNRIISDLSAFGATPIFPDSAMQISPKNENSSINISKTAELFAQYFPDIPQNFSAVYSLSADLPATVESGGKSYSLPVRHIILNSLFPPSENGTIKIVFTPIGDRIIEYTVQEYSAPNVTIPTFSINPTAQNSTAQQTNSTTQNSSPQIPASPSANSTNSTDASQ